MLEHSLLLEPALNALGSESQEAALKELLRGRSVYEVGQAGCAVKPYGSGPVSMPKYLDKCLSLEDSLPSEDFFFQEGNHERMRNHDPELVPIKPYFDVVLKRNRRTYVKCIRQLLELGLVRVTDICISEVGMFCSAKKDGSLR